MTEILRNNEVRQECQSAKANFLESDKATKQIFIDPKIIVPNECEDKK